MANNPFDPPMVQVKKTLDRGGISTVNKGFGSLKSGAARTRPAPPSENLGIDALSNLNDVDTTTLADGHILKWNAITGLWTASTNEAVVPGLPKDRRWTVGSGETSIDEFNNAVIDPVWTFPAQTSIPALPSLARPRYVENGDVVSVKYGPLTGVGVGVGEGATARHSAMVRPLSSIGGPMAVGDAFYTALDTHVRSANFRMSGLVLSTSAADTGNRQLYCRWWNNSVTNANVGMRDMVAWANDTNIGTDSTWRMGLIYIRIVRLSTTTWRYDISPDGISWMLGQTASTWAFEPTHVGFADSNWNTTTVSVTGYEFIRRVSGVA